MNKHWSFEYGQEHLYVTVPGNRHYHAMIAVKQKDVNDGKVDIASYTTVPPFSKTTVANPPQVSLMENQLVIVPPQPKNVEMIRFNHDFTFAQFTGERTSMHNIFYRSHQVLYIQVPPNLTVDGEDTTVAILHLY